jgi:site-specific DNA recombinase
MVRRGSRTGIRVRFNTKAELLAGGADVRALRYQRASQDKKEQGKSVHDQGVLNLKEIGSHGWTDADSFTDNDRSASRHATKERENFPRLLAAIRAGKGDVLVIWEISRRERDLAVYVQIRDMCTEVGLYFWLVGGCCTTCARPMAVPSRHISQSSGIRAMERLPLTPGHTVSASRRRSWAGGVRRR